MKRLVFILTFGVVLGVLISIFLQAINSPSATKKENSNKEVAAFNYCTRQQAYGMEPRFERALSLIDERTNINDLKSKSVVLGIMFPYVKNCLNIIYCPEEQMAGAEGLFFFSSEVSSRDKYVVCVSKKYQAEDDLLTSVILAHEITHAAQFVFSSTNTYTRPITCYELEANAFSEEVWYVLSLTQGEISSLLTRTNLNGVQTEQTKDLGYLIGIGTENYNANDVTALSKIMDEYVKSNPYYQKQCSLKV